MEIRPLEPRRLCGETLHRPLSNRRGITTSAPKRVAFTSSIGRSRRRYGAPSTANFSANAWRTRSRSRVRGRHARGVCRRFARELEQPLPPLEHLRVRRRRARECVGSKLLAAIEGAAQAAGARMLVLETQSCNENAIAFYRKNGFQMIWLRPVCLFQRRPRAAGGAHRDGQKAVTPPLARRAGL